MQDVICPIVVSPADVERHIQTAKDADEAWRRIEEMVAARAEVARDTALGLLKMQIGAQ